MKLSLADKLALIYTSAGSLRAVAAFTGISRATIRRELEGTATPNRRPEFARELARAVDVAFQIHKDATKAQARADHLPFDPAIPIFIQRLPFKDGTPGDRVGALHTHWLPDELRNQWLRAMHKSGKFYATSVQSIVNLVVYNKRAEARVKQRDRQRNRDRDTIQNKIQQQIITGPIYTPYTGFDSRFPFGLLLQDIQNKLRSRHEPATGDPGTALSSGVLFQVDTRGGRDAAFRNAHPFADKKPAGKRAKAKQRKAGRSPKRAR